MVPGTPLLTIRRRLQVPCYHLIQVFYQSGFSVPVRSFGCTEGRLRKSGATYRKCFTPLKWENTFTSRYFCEIGFSPNCWVQYVINPESRSFSTEKGGNLHKRRGAKISTVLKISSSSLRGIPREGALQCGGETTLLTKRYVIAEEICSAFLSSISP